MLRRLSNTVLTLTGSAILLYNIHCTQRNHASSDISAQDSMRIVHESLMYRAETDSFLRYDPDSPFNRDTTIRYEGLRWFPIDVHYSVQSKLSINENPDTVTIFGTLGDPRPYLRYGYFTIVIDGEELQLNVYKQLTPREAADQLEVWFTDATTGHETYHVGRYVHIGEEQANRDYFYTINFNNAYNPYCAYSALYSCAIPRKENHLAIAIRAGELNYQQK